MPKIKIAPSILSADFSCLDREIKKVELSGADMLHIDVMDGHFVPNITIGPVVVRHIRKVTKLPLDVHLMIDEPARYIKDFAQAGSNIITVHVEAIKPQDASSIAKWVKRERGYLNSQGIKLGISLNPDTPLSRIKPLLDKVDLVLVMSVFPGFSGQKFIYGVLPKIKKLRAIFAGDICVDGGVNKETAGLLIKAGANILASGSYIFGARDVKTAIERIRNAR